MSMNEKIYQRKLQRLTEIRDAYKSALIAEGFMDLLIDLVFGREIKKASSQLANDPEFVKGVKKLKQIDQELIKLQKSINQTKSDQLAHYFITYGIDLYDLDEYDRAKEIYGLVNRMGKYRNITPLSKQQQEFNRKLVSKKRY